MTSRSYLRFAVLFLCRACFAQVPSSEPTVSAAPPNANAELKLDDATLAHQKSKATRFFGYTAFPRKSPFGVLNSIKGDIPCHINL
jgi:hypothetical protein